MNELHLFPANRFHLVLASRRQRRRLMTALTARLALAGAVRILDGGNSFDGYGLARLLRQHTAQWQAALARTTVARAFTCYQMAALLNESAASTLPTLVLDLLDTFYDENVALAERSRLLSECLPHLQRLGQGTSMAVSVELPVSSQVDELLEQLVEAAGQVWHFEIPVPASPPRLF